MQLPFEIVQNIISRVNARDLSACITVCKSWHQPSLEALYEHVVLRSRRSFRIFLSVVAHHELLPGRYVKSLSIHTEQNNMNKERPITFTEFELLSRFCPGLTELLFHHNQFWRYLDELDLQSAWPYLRKLPRGNSVSSISVISKLQSRLYEIDVCTNSRARIDFSPLLSSSLQKVSLQMPTRPTYMGELKRVHECSPSLRELSFMVYMENSSDAIDLPFSGDVQTLSCIIHHPDSAWFPLIASNYHQLQRLNLSFSKPKGQLFNIPYREDFLPQDLLRQLVNLIDKTPHIQEFQVSFRDKPESDLVIMAAITLPYSQLRYHGLGSIKIVYSAFCYSEDYTGNRMFELTARREQEQTHYTIRFRLEQDSTHLSPIALLQQHVMLEPLNQFVTELDICLEHSLFFYLASQEGASKRGLFLDSLLTHFSNLSTLSIYAMGRLHNSRHVALSLSPDISLQNNAHRCLRTLHIKRIPVKHSVYQFLFKYCTELSQISMLQCSLDEETTLMLELLCCERDIALNVE